ncbi:MAG: sulfatase [Planctomycetales bacterium]|nr:sulfatase [Planctomycetales bacterium]
MKRRCISLLFSASLWLLIVAAARSLPAQLAASVTDRPNVVFLLADDLGWADLGCYGSELHETPNLDRLSSQGVRFTDAYAASPVCTPTRASILTGKHPARLHMTIWREAALNQGNRRLLEPICLDSLPATEMTSAKLLKEAGYYNVHIGKWHVGRAEAYPQVHGFHRNIGGTLWGAPQSFWYPFNGDQYFSDWRYVPDLEPGQPGQYLTDALTAQALQVMEDCAKAKRPFFINLWYHAVHTPIEGKPDLVRHYEAKITNELRQRNPYYAAMVHSLDENVGRVLGRIDELGLAENTLVVFSSDNGGFVNTCKLHSELQVANNTPLRSGKGSCYEGGVRVPLIVRGPKVAAAAVCSTPVYSCDFFPTLLDATDIAREPSEPIDGLSLAPLLSDPSAEITRDALYFHYPHYYPTTTPVSAIRKGNWKLLEYYEDNLAELYDLSVDMGENKNLAAERPDLVQQLRSQLQAWRTRIGAQEPTLNPNFE